MPAPGLARKSRGVVEKLTASFQDAKPILVCPGEGELHRQAEAIGCGKAEKNLVGGGDRRCRKSYIICVCLKDRLTATGFAFPFGFVFPMLAEQR